MDSLQVLGEVRIASPCDVPWEEMVGDDRERFCGVCSRTVYNLSAMPTDEAAALVRGADGPMCVQLYKRADGTVMTADCPIGARGAAARRLGRLVVRGMAAILLVTFGSAASIFGMSIQCGGLPAPPSLRRPDLGDWKAWGREVFLGESPQYRRPTFKYRRVGGNLDTI